MQHNVPGHGLSFIFRLLDAEVGALTTRQLHLHCVNVFEHFIKLLIILPIALIAVYASQASQTISLYLDGVFTAKADLSLTVVKDQHELQAIHVEDSSVGAVVFFLSSSSNGVRTDGTSWRCSNQYHEGWFLPNFTDHSWPRPYATVSNTFFIASDAQWIAYPLAQSNTIFCRRSTFVGKRDLVHTIHQLVSGCRSVRTIEKVSFKKKTCVEGAWNRQRSSVL